MWHDFLFEQILIHFTLECFVPRLVEIRTVELKKNIFKILLFRFYDPLEKAWPFM